MQIPKDFLVQMLGEERVTKFAMQEILNSTMADYAKKASDFYHSICASHRYKLISTFDDPYTGKLGCQGQEDKHDSNSRRAETIIQTRKGIWL